MHTIGRVVAVSLGTLLFGTESRTISPAPEALRADALVIDVAGLASAAPLAFRIVGTGGRLTAAGIERMIGTDTTRVTGPAHLTSDGIVSVMSFIADRPGAPVHVTARRGTDGPYEASGDMVVVIRTPLGVQVQAMHAPAELR